MDVLHDDEELAALRDDVDRLNDVGMTDASNEPRLVEEHRDEIRIAGIAFVEAFDRHDSRKARSSDLSCEMDRRHPARRDLRTQLIPLPNRSHDPTAPRHLYAAVVTAVPRSTSLPSLWKTCGIKTSDVRTYLRRREISN
jgi:hypothetical protein